MTSYGALATRPPTALRRTSWSCNPGYQQRYATEDAGVNWTRASVSTPMSFKFGSRNYDVPTFFDDRISKCPYDEGPSLRGRLVVVIVRVAEQTRNGGDAALNRSRRQAHFRRPSGAGGMSAALQDLRGPVADAAAYEDANRLAHDPSLIEVSGRAAAGCLRPTA